MRTTVDIFLIAIGPLKGVSRLLFVFSEILHETARRTNEKIIKNYKNFKKSKTVKTGKKILEKFRTVEQ